MRIVKGLFAALCIAGCSSPNRPSPNAGSASSPAIRSSSRALIAAAPFVPTEATWAVNAGHGFDFRGPALFVSVTDFGGNCAAWSARSMPSGGRELILAIAVLRDDGSSVAQVPPGTYPVQPLGRANNLPHAAYAEAFLQTGCGLTPGEKAVSGTITLTAVSADEVEGRFSLSVSCEGFDGCEDQTPAPLAGEFHASHCGSINVNHTLSCAR